MLRTILWFVVWLLSLGMLDIEVKYSDGLSIRFISWPSKLADRWRKAMSKNKDPFDGKRQLHLVVYWEIDAETRPRVRRGETTTHIGDEIFPPLSNREMQDIVYAAKTAYAKAVRERKASPEDKREEE